MGGFEPDFFVHLIYSKPIPMKTFICLLCATLMALPCFAQKEYFVKVDPVTGVHTIIDSLPGVKTIQTGPSWTTIDKVNNRYFFKGADASNTSRYYTVNAFN